jgi:hypothetical protein
MGGLNKKLNERMESVDQSFMDGISNVGGYIMGGLKNLLPGTQYEKNEETGEVVVKKSKQELQVLEDQARKEQQTYQQEITAAALEKKAGVSPVPPVETIPDASNSSNITKDTNTKTEPPIKVESSNNISSFNAFNNNKFIGARNLDISTSALENLKKSDENGSKQNKDMKSMFEESNDKNSSSRKRGGLFNNYGKQIEIKKTYDPTTGRTNRQKFVDGELASDRNNNQDMRRQRRSKEARGKRRAGRNK